LEKAFAEVINDLLFFFYEMVKDFGFFVMFLVLVLVEEVFLLIDLFNLELLIVL
jgi:hypothetical protein